MQPFTSTSNISKPNGAHAAGQQVQLELGDTEDSSDGGGDKPASNNPSRPPSRSAITSQAVVAPTTPIANNTKVKATATFKRMFRSSGDSTPRSGSATPQPVAHAATGAETPAVAVAAAAGSAATPHASSAPAAFTANSIDHDKSLSHPTSAGAPAMHWHHTPNTSISPTSTLPTTPPSEANDFSPPHSRPNSRPGSRKSSFSGTTANKPGSEHGGSSSGGQRFTLKDLLASGGPKLARRPSNSSRKSDASSDRGGPGGGGGPGTVGGESTTTSLLKKYGVCEKIAIGKGATSVVRLAHKWDRSEEKLYAVKIITSLSPP